MTLAGAAGVIANVEAESAFIEKNLQDTYEQALGYNDASYTEAVDNGSYQRFTRDAAGYGLAQWTAGDWKAKMLSYFKQRNKSIGDFRTQVAFLLYEMKSEYTVVWRTCTSSGSAYNCGYNVCKRYEIPANTEQQAQYRGSLANKWYEWLQANSRAKSTFSGADSGQSVATAGQSVAEPGESGGSAPAVKDEDGIEIPKTWPPRTIDRNCRGFPEVKLLQALLHCRGYNVLVDGIWTDGLNKAVQKFQEQANLTVDGCVGPMTWAALMQMKAG